VTTIALYKHWSPSHDHKSDRDRWAFEASHPWEWIKDARRIIDLGCGTGRMVQRFLAEGRDAIGITYQESELGHDHVYLGDMHSLPFTNEGFDAFVMWDSLEHCIAPLIALAEARRVLRPRGRGIIFMPGEQWIEKEYHIHVMNPRQMRHLIGLAGLRLWETREISEQPGAAFYLVEKP
jgi:ubiquinone/menaquinone biosynthesis C-methylase UbiE